IAVHIIETKRVGMLSADRVRGGAGIALEPGVVAERFFFIAEEPRSVAAGATRAFPFGLGRQAIQHVFALGEPIAERDGVLAADLHDRLVIGLDAREPWVAPVHLGTHDRLLMLSVVDGPPSAVALGPGPVLGGLDEAAKLADGHFAGAHVE